MRRWSLDIVRLLLLLRHGLLVVYHGTVCRGLDLRHVVLGWLLSRERLGFVVRWLWDWSWLLGKSRGSHLLLE